MKTIFILLEIFTKISGYCPEGCRSCGTTTSADGTRNTGLFYCDSGALTDVPYGYNTEQIRDLRLNDNKIKKIHQHDFGLKLKWPLLEVIHLEENEIDEIDRNSFQNLGNITTLFLSNNNLTTFIDGIWLQLESLNRLHLDHNQLETIPKDFGDMPQLKWLTMTNNNIFHVDWWHFTKINLQRFQMAKNPMPCNCDNYEFRMWSDLAFDDVRFVDLGFICREVEAGPANCTEPKVISAGHVRNVEDVYSDEYRTIYTVGQNATLFCNFTSNPTAKVRWINNKIGLDKNDTNPDVTVDGNIFIQNLTLEHTGSYWCNLETISYRKVERKVNMKIIEGTKPEVVGISTQINKVEGEYAKLSCNITSEPPPVIAWYYPNATIVDATVNVNKLNVMNLQGMSILTVRDLNILDQGNYKCKAHNFLGEIEADILMVVEVSEPEGDNYLLLVGGILVAFVVVAIFIVAGTYAKKYRQKAQTRRDREQEHVRAQPVDGMRI